jgi:hypothetical protein
MRGCAIFLVVFYVRNVISADAQSGVVIVVVRVIIIAMLNTSMSTACTTTTGGLSNLPLKPLERLSGLPARPGTAAR